MLTLCCRLTRSAQTSQECQVEEVTEVVDADVVDMDAVDTCRAVVVATEEATEAEVVDTLLTRENFGHSGLWNLIWQGCRCSI